MDDEMDVSLVVFDYNLLFGYNQLLLRG